MIPIIFLGTLLITFLGNAIQDDKKIDMDEIVDNFNKNYGAFEKSIQELSELESTVLINKSTNGINLEKYIIKNGKIEQETEKNNNSEKYQNTIKLFEKIELEEIYKDVGYISYKLKYGWSFAQEIVKIYDEAEYIKDSDIKEKMLLQDNWYYVILNGR